MMPKIIARTVRGLEWVCAAEASSRLPEVNIRMAPREITFSTDRLRDLADLRTADDVFVEVGRIGHVGSTKADIKPLVEKIIKLDWPGAVATLASVRPLPPMPRFDVVVSLDGNRTYSRFDVENAAGTDLAPRLRGVHLPRTRDSGVAIPPDVTVRIFLHGQTATVALRLSQRPLHRREYKQATGSGTLHPPVAAMLSMIAAPKQGETIADPFCGDGTIAIEAALQNPGVRVLASDIDPVRVANAIQNAERAGTAVEFQVSDASQLQWPDRTIDAIVTNPPWNIAVRTAGRLSRSLDPFWRDVRSRLSGAGRVCVIADADLRVPQRLTDLGYRVGLSTQIRLAGHISEVILAAPSGANKPHIPERLDGWRKKAIDLGIVTASGW